jgi:hypothetical protein
VNVAVCDLLAKDRVGFVGPSPLSLRSDPNEPRVVLAVQLLVDRSEWTPSRAMCARTCSPQKEEKLTAASIGVRVAIPESPQVSHKRARHRAVIEIVLVNQKTRQDDLVADARATNNLVDLEADSGLRL